MKQAVNHTDTSLTQISSTTQYLKKRGGVSGAIVAWVTLTLLMKLGTELLGCCYNKNYTQIRPAVRDLETALSKFLHRSCREPTVSRKVPHHVLPVLKFHTHTNTKKKS